MTTVFVTGPTGNVGSGVVDALLARGAGVVAGVPDQAGAEPLPSGVEPRSFSFGAPSQELDEGLAGVDSLFLLRLPQIADVQTRLFPVIDAARRGGLSRIVLLSLQGVQHNKATPHHAVERYLRQTEAPYTFLRPNFFMQNLSTVYAAESRDRDEIYLPAGRSLWVAICGGDSLNW